MVDKVRPLKYERSPGGTENNRRFATETDPSEDYVSSKGIAFEDSDSHTVDLDEEGNIRFKDSLFAAGKSLRDIIADAVNRTNHTSTQPSSTISDFSSTVRSTLITGISFATSTAIVAGDTILSALGKLQAQLNLFNAIVMPSSTSTANLAGTSSAHARADHTHKTEVHSYSQRSNEPASTTALTDVGLPNALVQNPLTGTYILSATVVLNTSQTGAGTTFSIYVGGVMVPGTDETITRGGNQASGHNQTYAITSRVTVNGSQDVEIRWRTSAGTATAFTRSLTLIKVS